MPATSRTYVDVHDYDPDYDIDMDACTNCGCFYSWLSVQSIVDAHPTLRPFPQRCRPCLAGL